VFELKGQAKIDEFAFVLLAGIVLILVLTVGWSAMEAGSLVVSPTSKLLTIAKGSSSSFQIHVNGTAKNVTIEGLGDISDWVDFDKNNFDVSGPADVTVVVNVPNSAKEKFYTGTVKFTYSGGENSVSLTINVSTITISDISRNINLGAFSLKYLVGSEPVYEKEDFEVSKGYFSESPVSFAVVLTEEMQSIVTGGSIQLIVDDTNGAGNLIIELNGQEIFNERASVGEHIIQLSKDQILKSNAVRIRADSPGWKFWMNSAYKIRSFTFFTDYNGVFFKDVSFALDSTEATNFKFGKIAFKIKKYDKNRLPNMEIKVNDKEIFNDIPTLTYFSKTFTDVPLNIGPNTISFSLDRDGFYDLEDVILTIARSI